VTTKPQLSRPRAAPSVRRVLDHVPPPGAWADLHQHRAQAGALPHVRTEPDGRLLAEVDRSGLRGRGGAGFPTSIKLRAVAKGRPQRIVVANGTEGEPASAKDKLLLANAPHLVIDGALVAAAAVGASEIFLCVDRTATTALEAVHRALAERAALEPPAVPIRVAATPPRYVAGEETALVNWLNGADARPTVVPPRPFERGVKGRPTLVDNVETLCHLALIARHGADWFRELGTADEPGTTLLTLSGAVKRPGIYEVPMGRALGRVLEDAGAPADAAVLAGGYFGTWLPTADVAGLALANGALRPLGASIGCGVVAVLPPGSCGIAETARVLGWLANETAGQCGPCVNGLGAVADTMAAVSTGRADRHDGQRLLRWAGQIEGRGACRLPDGAVRLLRSALGVFATDLDHHLGGHPCPAARHNRVLPLPHQREVMEWR